jgi:hypothetical protein
MIAAGARSCYHTQNVRLTVDQIVWLLYLTVLVFDYRRDTDGSSSLVVLVGLSNIALGIFLIFRAHRIRSNVLLAVLPIAIFIAGAIFTGFLYGQPVRDTIARAVPVSIFVLAAINAAAWPMRGNAERLIKMIIVASILAAIWKIIFGFLYTGKDIETIRYQIISGSLPLAFSFAIAALLVKRRRFMFLALIVSVAAVALSVTRSFLVIYVASVIAATLSMPRVRLSRTIVRATAAIMLIALGIAVGAVAYPEVAARWVTRFGMSSQIGFDLTAQTRIAEASYQIQRLADEPIGLLFGFGHAAETGYAGRAAELVYSVLRQSKDHTGVGYGHIFYIGIVFVGGLVFGLPVLLVLFSTPFKASQTVRRKWDSLNDTERFVLIWSIGALAGYLSAGLLSSPWGDRSMSFFFGLSFGLAFFRSPVLR